MRTLDGRFSAKASLGARIKRDVLLLFTLARQLIGYAITGGRVRRDYRDKERRGKVFYFDDDGQPQ